MNSRAENLIVPQDRGIQAAPTLMQRKDVPALAMEVYGGSGVYSSQPYVDSTLKWSASRSDRSTPTEGATNRKLGDPGLQATE